MHGRVQMSERSKLQRLLAAAANKLNAARHAHFRALLAIQALDEAELEKRRKEFRA